MSKQYAHLHAMAKTSVKFQNDWQKTVGGVALTSQLLTNGRVTARLYRTCVLTQVRQKSSYGHLHPAKIQISLHILTVWSDFPLGVFLNSQGCNVSSYPQLN